MTDYDDDRDQDRGSAEGGNAPEGAGPPEAEKGPGTDRGGRDSGSAEPPEGSETPGGRGGRIDFKEADNEVEEAGEESFPASDPPSYGP